MQVSSSNVDAEEWPIFAKVRSAVAIDAGSSNISSSRIVSTTGLYRTKHTCLHITSEDLQSPQVCVRVCLYM